MQKTLYRLCEVSFASFARGDCEGRAAIMFQNTMHSLDANSLTVVPHLRMMKILLIGKDGSTDGGMWNSCWIWQRRSDPATGRTVFTAEGAAPCLLLTPQPLANFRVHLSTHNGEKFPIVNIHL